MDQITLKVLEIQQEMNRLKIEITTCEKWIERANDTLYQMQEMIFDLQDKGIAV